MSFCKAISGYLFLTILFIANVDKQIPSIATLQDIRTSRCVLSSPLAAVMLIDTCMRLEGFSYHRRCLLAAVTVLIA